jgi:hypothetical protein
MTMKNKLTAILSILSSLIAGIGIAIIITKYSYYIAFISIALIVAVACHIVLSKLIHKEDE